MRQDLRTLEMKCQVIALIAEGREFTDEEAHTLHELKSLIQHIHNREYVRSLPWRERLFKKWLVTLQRWGLR